MINILFVLLLSFHGNDAAMRCPPGYPGVLYVRGQFGYWLIQCCPTLFDESGKCAGRGLVSIGCTILFPIPNNDVACNCGLLCDGVLNFTYNTCYGGSCKCSGACCTSGAPCAPVPLGTPPTETPTEQPTKQPTDRPIGEPTTSPTGAPGHDISSTTILIIIASVTIALVLSGVIIYCIMKSWLGDLLIKNISQWYAERCYSIQ
jgi:hypothetical protein